MIYSRLKIKEAQENICCCKIAKEHILKLVLATQEF